MDTRDEYRELTEGFLGVGFADASTCPICGGDSVVVECVRTINPVSNKEFELRECLACAHWWINPMPRQELLSHLYATASANVIWTQWAQTAQKESSDAERRVLEAERGRIPGRLLEIGVGKGVLFRAFGAMGWECHGIEPGDWGALPNVKRSIEEIDPKLRFDAIVAMDVLEHLSEPAMMLGTLREMAAPNCRLYAAFPNKDSMRARMQKGHWRMMRPLGHVHFWGRHSLRRTFEKARWSVIRATRNDLWTKDALRRWTGVPLLLVQWVGLGDQWFVIATPKNLD